MERGAAASASGRLPLGLELPNQAINPSLFPRALQPPRPLSKSPLQQVFISFLHLPQKRAPYPLTSVTILGEQYPASTPQAFTKSGRLVFCRIEQGDNHFYPTLDLFPTFHGNIKAHNLRLHDIPPLLIPLWNLS